MSTETTPRYIFRGFQRLILRIYVSPFRALQAHKTALFLACFHQPDLHPLTPQLGLHFTTCHDQLTTTMLTKFVPLAVLISAPLLSNASPLIWGGGAAATVTIFQCPTSSAPASSSAAPASSSSDLAISSSAAAPSSSSSAPSSSASAASSSALAVSSSISVFSSSSVSPSALPTASADGGVAVVPAVANLVKSLGDLSSALDTVTNQVLPSALRSLQNLLSSLSSTLGALLGGLGGKINQLQSNINQLGSNLRSITRQLNTLNGALQNNNIPIGAPTGGQTIPQLGQNIFGQLNGTTTQLNNLADGINKIQKPSAQPNLGSFLTDLQNLIDPLSTFYSGLSGKCATNAERQALAAAYQAFLKAYNPCLLKFKALPVN
ncbi:hypothetical protein MSAN_00909300 [Mycena sanguinolenta]|uniref:Uncharacterized protein n=1 Tax=Mycena sanguinolenta TaxID=230812 RepID=A0A8H7D9R1_9AGAR|nr:hypothetical protein MSAN_00909300 [Mycena sanguinolenta]